MPDARYAGCFRILTRLVYNCFLTVMVLMVSYFAGWMLAGVSGMMLSPVATSITGNDYSREFLHTFPIGGKVIGVLIGLWFLKGTWFPRSVLKD